MGEEESVESASDKIKSALLVQHMPSSYLRGIHRLLLILCESADSFTYDPIDLSPFIAEIIGVDEEDNDFAANCIAVGSEFEVITVKRDTIGRVNLIDVGLYATPFLAGIIGDYDTALEASIRVHSRFKEMGEKYDRSAEAAISLFGHWAAIGISAITASLSESKLTSVNSFKDELKKNLNGFVDPIETKYWLTYTSIQKALSKLSAVGLIEHKGDNYELNKPSAVRFLTAIGEYELLGRVQSD